MKLSVSCAKLEPGKPMSETREHRLLVAALVARMQHSSITVLSAAAPGWPRPPLIGGRRPDVVGFYRPGGSIVAGEAKRGPELWGCLSQLEDIAAALPELGPQGSGALLILGVMSGWESEAKAVCELIQTPRTSSQVWSPGPDS